MSYSIVMSRQQFALAFGSMLLVVLASNILVQYPLNSWLTWGALTYPVSFLISDLLNRRFGPGAARQVVYIGFAAAVLVSIWLATPRIALASGGAFLLAQLLDIKIFDRLRHGSWWRAPLLAGVFAAILDTFVFFSVAFAGTDFPWWSLMLGDLSVKLLINLFMLAPFRALMWNIARPNP